MRDLRFIVNGSDLKKDPKCSFTGMVAGSSNYFRAAFEFNEDWAGMRCVAEFESTDGVSKYEPIIDQTCAFPNETLRFKKFRLRVIGVKDNAKFTSKWCNITQLGGE